MLERGHTRGVHTHRSASVQNRVLQPYTMRVTQRGMPPKPLAGVAAQSALNIRLTAEDLNLLDQQVELAAHERLARDGDDASAVSRATLVRRWIRDGARARGLLPPKPVQASLPFAPVVPVVAPVVAPVVPVVAPVVPVVAPVAPPAEEAAPVVPVVAPVAPPRAQRKAPPDVDTVRAALAAARAAGVAQRTIADAVEVDPSTLSKFQNTDPAKHRPLSTERLAALAAFLTKAGHMKR